MNSTILIKLPNEAVDILQQAGSTQIATSRTSFACGGAASTGPRSILSMYMSQYENVS